MSDPLLDPRAADLLTARTDQVGTIAQALAVAAGESQETAIGLHAARDSAAWGGDAGDAFREAFGRLPAHLTGVSDGLAGVADALTLYESELGPLQSAFRRLVDELHHAGAALQVAPSVASAAQLETLRARGFRLLDEFEEARDGARTAIARVRANAPSQIGR